ncbi:MAG: AzlD domain-containing protein [Eubacterium sp.]|nr:AzlD domain-containing protein [Eubacterium sp.]
MIHNYAAYVFVMAFVTYLIRVIPFVAVTGKIKNRFFRSFLYYVPYTVLTAMTVPAIFFATGSVVSAAAGFVVAMALALMNRGLITVALSASAMVLVVDLAMSCL